MLVVVRYHAQLRQAAGVPGETISVDEAVTVEQLLGHLGERHPGLRRMLLDERGARQPTLLVFVGDRQARGPELLRDGDEVSLLTPIAGGGSTCRADGR